MGWYTVAQLEEKIYCISEPFGMLDERFGIETVNMYLVIGETRAALVDTGTGIGYLPDVVRSLTTLPCVVLNTHFHWDHVGGNSRFEETGIHADEAHLVAQEPDVSWMIEPLQSPRAQSVLPQGFVPAAYRVPAKSARFTFQQGDTIDLGGRALGVIHIPGHSPGHSAFFDAFSGALFTGDGAYPGPMYACFAGGNPEAFARSLRHMAALEGIAMVCPGHNDTVCEQGWLERLADGAEAALAGEVTGEPGDGFIEGKEFKFDGFSIWLP